MLGFADTKKRFVNRRNDFADEIIHSVDLKNCFSYLINDFSD